MCSSPLAKLGDTQELEEFIADLDRALEGTLEQKFCCLSIFPPCCLSFPQLVKWG